MITPKFLKFGVITYHWSICSIFLPDPYIADVGQFSLYPGGIVKASCNLTRHEGRMVGAVARDAQKVKEPVALEGCLCRHLLENPLLDPFRDGILVKSLGDDV